jgi:hypothetical protein
MSFCIEYQRMSDAETVAGRPTVDIGVVEGSLPFGLFVADAGDDCRERALELHETYEPSGERTND